MLVAVSSNAQWVNYTLPYNGFVSAVDFYNVNTGVSVGRTTNVSTGQFYYTTNAGINWILASSPSEISGLSAVQFINSTTVYAGGSETISNMVYKSAFLKSTNSGMNWVKAGIFDSLSKGIDNMHFLDANNGYALMDSSLYGNSRLYKTTNAGSNWQMINLVESGMKLKNIYFFDANTGFVSGRKYNGGPAGLYGVIYKTTNGGLNFIKTTFSTVNEINDFTFLNSTTGIATGTGTPGGTKIYRTTNAGIQWDSISFIQNRYMNNIESIHNTGTAFAVGNMMDTVLGYIVISTIKTTNFGTSWIVKEVNQNTVMYGLSLIDQNNFMMSGGDIYTTPNIARIFKSTNGGNVFVNNISTETPSAYSLEQNYPNPFNPVTRIKFNVASSPSITLQRGTMVKLVVYDVMGREVETLVNERLQAGTYETAFDGTGLNSGVYFYKLVAGEFTETKRMLLIK